MPHCYDAVQLYDLGFGPRLISVTQPGCVIAPGSNLRDKDRGKAPGYVTQDGWVGANVNAQKFRCLDYKTAQTWRDTWGANVGFVTGDGFVVIDNDQGKEFSSVLMALLNHPLRRFVLDPKHERDAFFLRVIDFVGDGVPVSNIEMRFRNGTKLVRVQILARGKQSVIAGTHPETRAPYAWSRELTSLDDIPQVTLEQFQGILDELVRQVARLGWNLETSAPTVSAAPSVSAVSANAGNNIPPIIPTLASLGHNHPPEDDNIQGIIADAKAILDDFPNREVPPGETPNAIDKWLDDYPQWVDVGYRLAGFLGERIKRTPEALDLWCVWSDGRAQPGQPSLSVWKSVIAQSTRYESHALLDLVRQYAPAKPEFPDDLDPNEFPPEPPKPSRTPIWDEIRARWVYSPVRGFIDTHTGRMLKEQSFSNREAYRARPLSRELGFTAVVSAATAFFRQPDRVEVFDITYAPGDLPFVVSLDPDLPSFNRWKATTILAQSVAPSLIQIWLDHLTFVLGSEQERDRFLKWCAFVAQHPKLKPNWHFLVISKAGLGKDTMTAPLKLAVGAGNHIDILSYALTEPFNPWAEHKLVIVGETARTSSPFSTASEVNNRLKPLLAAPPLELTVNRKNKEQYEIPNRTAVIMFSNDYNPLYLERNSRRVHVINRLGEAARDQGYYESVYKWLDEGGAALCAAYLLTLSLTDADIRLFNGGVAPSTPDKIELEEQNVQPQQAALEDLIEDARNGITADTPYNLVATASELSGYIKLTGAHRPPSARTIGAWLSTMPGVRRIKTDPTSPQKAGVVNAMLNGVKHSGRLWALSEKAPDGRDWSTLTEAQIVAIWKNLPTPSSATIIPLKTAKSAFPDDEEPV